MTHLYCKNQKPDNKMITGLKYNLNNYVQFQITDCDGTHVENGKIIDINLTPSGSPYKIIYASGTCWVYEHEILRAQSTPFATIPPPPPPPPPQLKYKVGDTIRYKFFDDEKHTRIGKIKSTDTSAIPYYIRYEIGKSFSMEWIKEEQILGLFVPDAPPSTPTTTPTPTATPATELKYKIGDEIRFIHNVTGDGVYGIIESIDTSCDTPYKPKGCGWIRESQITNKVTSGISPSTEYKYKVGDLVEIRWFIDDKKSRWGVVKEITGGIYIVTCGTQEISRAEESILRKIDTSVPVPTSPLPIVKEEPRKQKFDLGETVNLKAVIRKAELVPINEYEKEGEGEGERKEDVLYNMFIQGLEYQLAITQISLLKNQNQ